MTKPDKILRRKDVESITGLSRSTIYRKMHDGSFPQSITLSQNSVGWLELEIQSWIEEKIIARSSQTHDKHN
jgi:prophage regulatory protein